MAAQSTTDTFSLFPKLPLELRRAIWKLLLPYRAVEIDYPHPGVIQIRCELRMTTTLNSAIPLISHVNREARLVAFENGGWTDHLKLFEAEDQRRAAEGIPMNRIPHPWLSPSFDTIHMNWTHDYDFAYMVGDESILAFLRYCAQSKAAYVSLHHDVVFNFKFGYDGGLIYEDFELFENWRKYKVCLNTISIHKNRTAAATSGLFGTLGEERLQMVDAIDNNETLEKFHQLWLSQPVQDEQSGAFFELFTCGALEQQAKQWCRNLETFWCWYKSNQLPRQQFIGVEDPGEIWLVRPHDLDPKRFGEARINKDLQWIKEILKAMPEFRSVVMFRLCPMNCGMNVS